MFRVTSLFALLLIVLSACEPSGQQATDSNADAGQETAAAEEENTTPVTAIPQDFGGELKIIDDKIKSPRKELSGEIAGVPVTINYGSPAVNDRVIYGDLVPYNNVWRTGANEATQITFGEDVIVGADGKKLKAGKYALFTLPTNKNDWQVIFNTETDQWGAYDYDESKDAVRASAIAKPNAQKAERMDFQLAGESIRLMWDDLVVEFPVSSTGK